jgi:hypothetical protein
MKNEVVFIFFRCESNGIVLIKFSITYNLDMLQSEIEHYKKTVKNV